MNHFYVLSFLTRPPTENPCVGIKVRTWIFALSPTDYSHTMQNIFKQSDNSDRFIDERLIIVYNHTIINLFKFGMQQIRKDRVDMSSVKTYGIRTYMIFCLVISLCLCGLAGIVILIKGSFGIIEQKVLASTAIFALYSILGLCCSMLTKKQRYLFVSYAGISVCIAGVIYSLLFIWAELDSIHSNYGKFMVAFIIVAVVAAHSSLILMVPTVRRLFKAGLAVTIGAMIVVALMTIYLIFSDDILLENGLYFRIMGIFGIITALGTIVFPILARVLKTTDPHTTKRPEI